MRVDNEVHFIFGNEHADSDLLDHSPED
jgi:hypothetical protein